MFVGVPPAAAGVGALVGIGLGAVGAIAGKLAGGVLHTAAHRYEDDPLWLFPLGFPIGALGGAAVGVIQVAVFSGFRGGLADAALLGMMPVMAGGLVAGVVWVPYLAMRRRDRPGWPVLAVAVALSPFAVLIATLATLLATGI